MSHPIRVRSCSIYFLPVQTRTPYKFGSQVLSEVTCIRVMVEVSDAHGKVAQGWGETPLSAQWAWPGNSVSLAMRINAMKRFCIELGKSLVAYEVKGHPMEIGHRFQKEVFHRLRKEAELEVDENIPYLAGLVCLSAFDIAIHDAYGHLLGLPVYETYGAGFVDSDLSSFLESDSGLAFKGKYITDYISADRPLHIPAWHSVGAGDPLVNSDLTGNEPNDAYPKTLEEWIERDGLNCLKIKLSGADYEHDYRRIVEIGEIARRHSCEWLCADFNCTVKKVEFVTEMLARLSKDAPDTFKRILYVEQPFSYEMDLSPSDVRAVSELKPLFMDESAHDWELVKEGRKRGWTGVALKTCKTQTNALLMQAWARAHSMPIMVQDLTNPMLAQIPHVLLAAHSGTIMGLETNAMQYYPDASLPEAEVHPGLYRRVNGMLDTRTIGGPGFGYRLSEINRTLPEVACQF